MRSLRKWRNRIVGCIPNTVTFIRCWLTIMRLITRTRIRVRKKTKSLIPRSATFSDTVQRGRLAYPFFKGLGLALGSGAIESSTRFIADHVIVPGFNFGITSQLTCVFKVAVAGLLSLRLEHPGRGSTSVPEGSRRRGSAMPLLMRLFSRSALMSFVTLTFGDLTRMVKYRSAGLVVL